MINLWDGLYGQEYVKTTLEYFINSDMMPHALLFTGQEGVGKDFTVIKLAQILNHASTENQNVSKLVSSLSEPYIKYIIPLPRGKNETDESGPYDKLTVDDLQLIRDIFEEKGKNPYYRVNIPKANNIKISSIREIKKFVMLEYSEIKYRIILISQAHLMNEEAQNALLKNLEEPPPGILFVLSTPYPEQLRETIRSRCWQIKFNPLNETDITEILIKHFQIERELALKVAPFAGGSVSTALEFIEAGFDEMLESVILLLRYSLGRKYNSAFSLVDKYLKMTNKEPLRLLLSMILNWMNDLERFRNNSEILFFKNHKEPFTKFNNKFPGIRISETVNVIDKLVNSTGSNINSGAILLRLIYELASLVTPLKVKV
jgi:DNA polymerase-3 subunit delta'